MVPRDVAGPPAWTHLAAVVLHACVPNMAPAQTILAFTLSTSADAAAGLLGLPAFQQVAALPQGPLLRMAVALQHLGPPGLDTALPGGDGGRAAARMALTTPPPPGSTLAAHLSDLAWLGPLGPNGRPRHRPIPVTTGSATVAALTDHQLSGVYEAREARHAAFAREAADAPNLAPPHPERQVQAALTLAWRDVPCLNAIRETLWRLSIGAVPGANIRPWRCSCDLHGAPSPSSRLHTFWECPVAQAVRQQLAAALPAGTSVRRANVWLLQPPAGVPGLCPRAWALAALAALEAMEFGRRYLYALRASPEWPDPGPAGHAALAGALPNFIFAAHIRPHVMAARDALVSRVANAAAGRVWRTLGDFAHLHLTPPPRWALTPAHPFLHVLPNGTLGLALPVGVVAPPDEDNDL